MSADRGVVNTLRPIEKVDVTYWKITSFFHDMY